MYLFDIFSKPFIFKVARGEEKRRTNFGGFLTLGILGLSIFYFVSILIIFFEK